MWDTGRCVIIAVDERHLLQPADAFFGGEINSERNMNLALSLYGSHPRTIFLRSSDARFVFSDLDLGGVGEIS